MRRNSAFVLRPVAGKYVIVPTGQAAEAFRGTITTNKTGKFLWDLLEEEHTEQSLACALVEKYAITEELATEAVKRFLTPLYPTGAIQGIE